MLNYIFVFFLTCCISGVMHVLLDVIDVARENVLTISIAMSPYPTNFRPLHKTVCELILLPDNN